MITQKERLEADYKRYKNDYPSMFELRRQADGEFMSEQFMSERAADRMNKSGDWNGVWVKAWDMSDTQEKEVRHLIKKGVLSTKHAHLYFADEIDGVSILDLID